MSPQQNRHGTHFLSGLDRGFRGPRAELGLSKPIHDLDGPEYNQENLSANYFTKMWRNHADEAATPGVSTVEAGTTVDELLTGCEA
jgi:hypothetical protein